MKCYFTYQNFCPSIQEVHFRNIYLWKMLTWNSQIVYVKLKNLPKSNWNSMGKILTHNRTTVLLLAGCLYKIIEMIFNYLHMKICNPPLSPSLYLKYLVAKRQRQSPQSFILQFISFLVPWLMSLHNLPSSFVASMLKQLYKY